MCFSPIIIRNNSSYIHTHYTYADYVVPCGHCYDCKSAKTTDWQVRCSEELNNNSQSYFYTLTLDPRFIDTYGTLPDGSPRYVFNKRHIQLFLKRLRKALSKYNISLKYVIVGELGETTHRPHYHAIFYLSSSVNPFKFRIMVRNSWSLGFIKSGDNNGIILNNDAVSYVIKYMHKTDSYLNGYDYHLRRAIMFKWYRAFRILFPLIPRPKYGIHYNLDNQDTLPEIEVIWNNFYDAARREYRSMCCFHLQSTNLGIPKDWSKYSNNVCFLRAHDGSLKTVRTPLYYIRKQYYDRLPDLKTGYRTLYRLNSDGLIYYSRTVADRLVTRMQDCENTLDYIKKNPSDMSIYEGSKLIPRQLMSYLSTIDLNIFTRNYSIYSVFYRGVVFEGGKTDLNTFESIANNPYRYYMIHKARLHNNISPIISHAEFINDYADFKKREIDNCMSLQLYSEFWNVVSNLKRKIGIERSLQRSALLESIRKTRDSHYRI
nr:unnamed protein product [uncultured bacterium]